MGQILIEKNMNLIEGLCLAWNDTEIGIDRPNLHENYVGTSNAERYSIDAISLYLSAKDQQWKNLKDLSKFEL